MAAYIERQIANRQFITFTVIMAAQQRAEVGVQPPGEGFNQIIICADIQPGNAVIERIAGGQNEYRQGVFSVGRAGNAGHPLIKAALNPAPSDCNDQTCDYALSAAMPETPSHA